MIGLSHTLIAATIVLASLQCTATTAFSFHAVNSLNGHIANELRTISGATTFLHDTRPLDRSVRSGKTTLFAKKKGTKRRRRKDGGNAKKQPTATGAPIDEPEDTPPIVDPTAELPDFDLVEDIDLVSSSSSSTTEDVGFASPSIDMTDPSAVMQAMKPREGAQKTFGSTKELIRSRDLELEKRLVVDDVTMEVPSLAEYTRRTGRGGGGDGDGDGAGGGGKMGKKATRAAARRNAAIEAEGAGVEDVNPAVALLNRLPKLPRLPFTGEVRDEKGVINPIKLIENAAWAGIYTLVIWEIYINSPLFTRALPMAPVVFSDPATML